MRLALADAFAQEPLLLALPPVKMDPRQRTAPQAGRATVMTGGGSQPLRAFTPHPTNPGESFVHDLFCTLKSYKSRFLPILRPGALIASLLAISLGGCDRIGSNSPLGTKPGIPRICGVAPWQGREAATDSDVVNRDLAVCLWEKSRLLADAPATNDELGRAIVGGCWDRVSAWGRVVSPASTMEEIDRVVARLQLQSLYWVIEARAGNCRLPTRDVGS
jgi:hypothetical protein